MSERIHIIIDKEEEQAEALQQGIYRKVKAYF